MIQSRVSLRSVAIGLLLMAVAAPGPARAVTVGDPAPGFSLVDLDGRTQSLFAESGKILLLDFIGYSAGVCVAPATSIQNDLYPAYKSRGVDFFAIDCWDGTSDQVQHFRDQTGVYYPVLQGGRQMAAAYDLSYNSFVVIDTRGMVRYVSAGPDPSAYDPTALTQTLDNLLGEANDLKDATWGAIKTLYNRKRL
jgi:peroxiredoxin